MSKIQPRPARKIWQPLNRQSQILATIAALAVILLQIYSWSVRSGPSQPVRPQTVQTSPEH
jgi:hypothetical protein